MILDWLIIGGGIHGTALSHYLLHRKGVMRARLRVIDPHEQPLALWRHHTNNTGMQYLRSPMPHHLHYDPWSLRTFAATRQGQPLANFIPRFQRPSLALFNAYSDWLIERYKLMDVRLQGHVMSLHKINNGWQIETTRGGLKTHRVVLCIGDTEHPYWPGWTDQLLNEGININHIFEPDFTLDKVDSSHDVVVVGGGISSAQTATTLAERSPGQVTMLSRHELHIEHFDSDPCWVTRLCLEDLHSETDWNKRRQIIQQARNKGSIPSNEHQTLQQAEQASELRIIIQPDSVQTLTELRPQQIILATGFETSRPGGGWLDQTIQQYKLPTAQCGYPIISQQLEWLDGLFVTGALAELEIGPVARNIVGARLAGERIGQVLA